MPTSIQFKRAHNRSTVISYLSSLDPGEPLVSYKTTLASGPQSGELVDDYSLVIGNDDTSGEAKYLAPAHDVIPFLEFFGNTLGNVSKEINKMRWLLSRGIIASTDHTQTGKPYSAAIYSIKRINDDTTDGATIYDTKLRYFGSEYNNAFDPATIEVGLTIDYRLCPTDYNLAFSDIYANSNLTGPELELAKQFSVNSAIPYLYLGQTTKFTGSVFTMFTDSSGVVQYFYQNPRIELGGGYTDMNSLVVPAGLELVSIHPNAASIRYYLNIQPYMSTNSYIKGLTDGQALSSSFTMYDNTNDPTNINHLTHFIGGESIVERDRNSGMVLWGRGQFNGPTPTTANSDLRYLLAMYDSVNATDSGDDQAYLSAPKAALNIEASKQVSTTLYKNTSTNFDENANMTITQAAHRHYPVVTRLAPDYVRYRYNVSPGVFTSTSNTLHENNKVMWLETSISNSDDLPSVAYPNTNKNVFYIWSADHNPAGGYLNLGMIQTRLTSYTDYNTQGLMFDLSYCETHTNLTTHYPYNNETGYADGAFGQFTIPNEDVGNRWDTIIHRINAFNSNHYYSKDDEAIYLASNAANRYRHLLELRANNGIILSMFGEYSRSKKYLSVNDPTSPWSDAVKINTWSTYVGQLSIHTSNNWEPEPIGRFSCPEIHSWGAVTGNREDQWRSQTSVAVRHVDFVGRSYSPLANEMSPTKFSWASETSPAWKNNGAERFMLFSFYGAGLVGQNNSTLNNAKWDEGSFWKRDKHALIKVFGATHYRNTLNELVRYSYDSSLAGISGAWAESEIKPETVNCAIVGYYGFDEGSSALKAARGAAFGSFGLKSNEQLANENALVDDPMRGSGFYVQNSYITGSTYAVCADVTLFSRGGFIYHTTQFQGGYQGIDPAFTLDDSTGTSPWGEDHNRWINTTTYTTNGRRLSSSVIDAAPTEGSGVFAYSNRNGNVFEMHSWLSSYGGTPSLTGKTNYAAKSNIGEYEWDVSSDADILTYRNRLDPDRWRVGRGCHIFFGPLSLRGAWDRYGRPWPQIVARRTYRLLKSGSSISNPNNPMDYVFDSVGDASSVAAYRVIVDDAGYLNVHALATQGVKTETAFLGVTRVTGPDGETRLAPYWRHLIPVTSIAATVADNGKVLKVVDGAPTWSAP